MYRLRSVLMYQGNRLDVKPRMCAGTFLVKHASKMLRLCQVVDSVPQKILKFVNL